MTLSDVMWRHNQIYKDLIKSSLSAYFVDLKFEIKKKLNQVPNTAFL